MDWALKAIVLTGLLAGFSVRAEEPAENELSLGFELLAADQSAFQERTDAEPKLSACAEREPTPQEVVRAAWQEAGLLSERDQSRQRRVRLSGWLPKLSGGLSKNIGDRWDFRYEPGTPRVDQLQQDDGLRWEFAATVDLSRAAYDPDEIQVTREASRRTRERMDLAAEILRLYYARRRLVLPGLPPPGSEAAVQLEEATALLDLWTGSSFSGRWCEVSP